MSARLPLCAWCGASIARKAYIVVRMTAIKSRPTIGWHWAESGSCASNDPARSAYEDNRDADALIDVVEMRGRGRVTRVGWTTTDARFLKLGRKS